MPVLIVEDYAPYVMVAQTFIEHFGYLCDELVHRHFDEVLANIYPTTSQA
ncbi:MAG: hypothetical protein JWO78_1111 [Micavibrio sp.]|nr:hypothetical protein [Micavibrio sp.]